MAWRRPESVLVIVLTDAGETLLLRRREPADYWQSVTGSLEWGETADAAARRELCEETGLSGGRFEDTGQVNEFEIVPPWTEKFAPGTRTNREYVYLLRLRERMPVTLDPDEHLEFRWLPVDEAIALAASSTNRDALRRLLKS